MAVFAVPGKVIRVEAMKCELRGGTYVMPDSRGNLCEEIKLIRSSAEAADVNAMRLLGHAYEADWDPSCPPQLSEAVTWYEKAAEKGDRQAAMALSRLLASGKNGLGADPARAKRWLDAALGTDSTALLNPDSQRSLSALEDMRKRVQDLEKQVQQLELERSKAPKTSADVTPKLQQLQAQQAELRKDYEKQVGKLDPRLLVAGATGAQQELQLVMLDPPIFAQRSMQPISIPITGSEKTRPEFEVIGRVILPEDKRSGAKVTVNGQPVETIEKDGFFRHPVPLTKTRNVNVEASLSGARAASHQFRLEFASEKQAAAAAADPPIDLKRSGRSIALVIGISNYNEAKTSKSGKQFWPNLDNARNDAEGVGKTLEKNYGFEVEYLLDENASYDRILSSLIRLRDTVRKDDQVIIYYAGHGEIDRVSTRGFWIPQDAWDQTSMGSRWIQSEQITNQIEAITAGQVLLISDSCYSAALNSAVGRVSSLATERSRANVIAELSKRNARLLMTSGSFSPVADGGAKGHSLFTAALLDSLQANTTAVMGRDLFNRVESMVLRRAREMRYNVNPQYGGLDGAGHLGGDFVFRRSS
ncbi:hypothetical protein BH11PSE11_BH11PSE11_04170 [soil metagenome]